MHHNGFSYKQPKGVPHKFSLGVQQVFVEHYQKLKKGKAPILFIDAVHPTQATKITHGWIRKGRDKLIETTGSRTRLNIVGALNLKDISATVTERYKTVNSENVAHFFGKLREKHYPLKQKIHVILDGTGYHRGKEVKEAAKKLNIVLHYSPSYSPNFNPIERLWKVMHEHARNNVYFPTKPLLRIR